MADRHPDKELHDKAGRMAKTELAKRYRAEYWALCKLYFDQLKAEREAANG